MIGWLLDTNVIAAIVDPNGEPSVQAWAAAQPEHRLFLSVLTLGAYDKGCAAAWKKDPLSGVISTKIRLTVSLLAQALIEGLIFVTADAALARYEGPVRLV